MLTPESIKERQDAHKLFELRKKIVLMEEAASQARGRNAIARKRIKELELNPVWRIANLPHEFVLRVSLWLKKSARRIH